MGFKLDEQVKYLKNLENGVKNITDKLKSYKKKKDDTIKKEIENLRDMSYFEPSEFKDVVYAWMVSIYVKYFTDYRLEKKEKSNYITNFTLSNPYYDPNKKYTTLEWLKMCSLDKIPKRSGYTNTLKENIKSAMVILTSLEKKLSQVQKKWSYRNINTMYSGRGKVPLSFPSWQLDALNLQLAQKNYDFLNRLKKLVETVSKFLESKNLVDQNSFNLVVTTLDVLSADIAN